MFAQICPGGRSDSSPARSAGKACQCRSVPGWDDRKTCVLRDPSRKGSFCEQRGIENQLPLQVGKGFDRPIRDGTFSSSEARQTNLASVFLVLQGVRILSSSEDSYRRHAHTPTRRYGSLFGCGYAALCPRSLSLFPSQQPIRGCERSQCPRDE
jgi:hypothetical protein